MEINKKHKEIKKGSSGMNYENYAERIKPLYDFDTYKKSKADSKNLVRISVKKGEVTTYTKKKNKFSQLNDKRFYFPSGIISLPFGHKYLEEINNYKNEKGQRIKKYFLKEKTRLLELENNCLKKNERLYFWNNILLQEPKIVSIDTKTINIKNQFIHNKSVLEFVLSAGWKDQEATTPTMENLMETY